MGQKLDAVTYVLGESLQLVKRAPEAKGTWDFMEMVARWLFPFGSGGIALLVQDYIPGVKNLYPWAMPSIVFVAAYAGLVFITAVRLRIQVVDLEEKTQPNLEITGPLEANMGVAGRGWALRVHNTGTESAKGCHGRLEDIKLEALSETISMERWPTDRDLHWSGQVEGASDYEIPGDQAATLNVIYCDSSGNLTLAYRAPEQFRMDHRITFDSPVLVLVNITSAGSIPRFVVCRIAPKSLSNNIYRGISGEQPFTLLWQGDERRSLAEFQVG